MSSETAVKIENISKCYHIYDKPRDRLMQMLMRGRKQYYREFWAVRNVSFEINKGETVGIVGRNGSGKSTLLQMICSTLNPTSGSLKTRGRIAALLELGSGFNPEFTGRENVYLNAAVLGLTRSETDECFDDILTFAEIGIFIDQPVKTYSSGMLVRLAFAVQAMVEPEILVVDEALAVGDEKFQRKCFARLEELKARGTAILFVSHSGPQVVELCDRALLMEGGECVMISTPQKVIRSYQQLIYAPEIEQVALLQEYREFNSAVALLPTNNLTTNSLAEADTAAADTVVDSFDQGLVPDSTTVYPEQGVRIEKIEIQGADGSALNVLTPMQCYRVVVSGVFLEDIEKLYFGIHIRSVSGAVISGQRHPEDGKYVECSKAGGQFQIEFWFDMKLLPGTYFIGGGVWSAVDPLCAHRILDAIMFRVQSAGAQKSFGYCDLIAAPANLLLS
jgi:lipopolysaccharide transport system ATP-binding protein